MRNHVSYLLLAEFDIAEGSVLRHQFPAETGVDEQSVSHQSFPEKALAHLALLLCSLLAEHMLPDGAHDRTDDWTIFYLNQIPALTVDPTSLLDVNGGDDKGKGKPVYEINRKRNEQEGGLLYVMSLVRTKKVATVRR